MATPLDISYRNNIMTKLALQIADSIKAGDLTGEQLAPISRDVLAVVEHPVSQEAFMSGVMDLAHTWPIFQPVVADLEQKAQALHNVETMFDRTKKDSPVS